MFDHILTGPVAAGLTRHLMTGIGGAMMASGVGTSTQWEAITGGLVAVVGVAFSVRQKRARY